MESHRYQRPKFQLSKWCFGLGLLAFTTLAGLPLRGTPSEPAVATPEVQWDLKIPMRDGIKLGVVVYRPKDQKEPLPVILTITPYTSRTTYPRGRYFSQQGYVFVSADIRGRGGSEGEFDPFVHDGPDGYDLVEWLAKQPWCNGKVGMCGGSYAGFAQWATAKELPPHLASMVPVASPYVFKDYPNTKGIDSPYNAQWLVYTAGHTDQDKAYQDDALWSSIVQGFQKSGLPYRQVDRFSGLPSPLFQRWLDHPSLDAHWASSVPSPEEYKRINIPILSLTGHYDDDQPSAMTYVREHIKFGSETAKAQHYVVMGPWDHFGTRTPAREYEGVDLGQEALMDLNALHKAWFDWTLKGSSKPAFLKGNVACYVVGPNEWVYGNSLEALTQKTQPYYLHSQGTIHGPESAGSLSITAPGKEPADAFQHDPLDPRPVEWEGTASKGGKLILPNAALVCFGRQFLEEALTYLTPPFTEVRTLTGCLRFSAWVRTDVPDEDFFAALFEVLPDGSVVQLAQDMVRARYRESMTSEKLLTPGQPTRLEFKDFPFFSRRIGKGSRLKLVFGALTTPWAERNYHSGKVVAEETAADAKVAHVELLHDKEHPSFLEIPVGK